MKKDTCEWEYNSRLGGDRGCFYPGFRASCGSLFGMSASEDTYCRHCGKKVVKGAPAKKRAPGHRYCRNGRAMSLREWEQELGRPPGYIRKRMSKLQRRDGVCPDEAFAAVMIEHGN